MSNKKLFDDGPIQIKADKLLLYWWKLGAHGAELDLWLYWHRGTNKFCLEGKLSYARIISIAKGKLCVVQDSNGNFTCIAKANIKIYGKKVARFDARVTQNINWDTGTWKLKKYDIEVCGSNTRKLKCEVWKDEFFNNTEIPELIIDSKEAVEDLQFILEQPEGIKDIQPRK